MSYATDIAADALATEILQDIRDDDTKFDFEERDRTLEQRQVRALEAIALELHSIKQALHSRES
jgi:hypothetical protein